MSGLRTSCCYYVCRWNQCNALTWEMFEATLVSNWYNFKFQNYSGAHHFGSLIRVGIILIFFIFQSNNGDTLPTANQDIFCCGQFTEDDCWYRARITKCESKGDKVEVIYVDYGNHESLTLSRLRMLRRDQAELPMMAVLCALDSVTSFNGVRGDISFCSSDNHLGKQSPKDGCLRQLLFSLPEQMTLTKDGLIWGCPKVSD